MKILLTLLSLRPEFGGPAYSVPRLAESLSQLGVEVGVWASDQTAVDVLAQNFGSKVVPLNGTVGDAINSFGIPDVIHDNGLWRPFNITLERIATSRKIARVVSPRGMLEPWAINSKKIKKYLAWKLFQRLSLERAQLIHATSSMEAVNVARFNLGNEIIVVPNGIDCPSMSEPWGSGKSIRTALFLSRLNEKKGILNLINAWSNLNPAGWRLLIAGPDENGYQKIVEREIIRHHRENDIFLYGPVYGQDKIDLFRSSEFFVFPSYSENFGIVVAEALSFGLPVLTTTGVPWGNIETIGCGWSVSPDEYGIREGLRQATMLKTAELRGMGNIGRDWVQRDFNWDEIASQFKSAYQSLI